jgi:hypothetical protein
MHAREARAQMEKSKKERELRRVVDPIVAQILEAAQKGLDSTECYCAKEDWSTLSGYFNNNGYSLKWDNKMYSNSTWVKISW